MLPSFNLSKILSEFEFLENAAVQCFILLLMDSWVWGGYAPVDSSLRENYFFLFCIKSLVWRFLFNLGIWWSFYCVCLCVYKVFYGGWVFCTYEIFLLDSEWTEKLFLKTSCFLHLFPWKSTPYWFVMMIQVTIYHWCQVKVQVQIQINFSYQL